jgi:hypothetical protein
MLNEIETSFVLSTAVKEVILEKEQFHCAKVIDVRVSPTDVANMLMYDLRSYILSEQLDNIRRVVEHPADWWQAFRQRWFPKCLLYRNPVKMKRHVIDIDFKALYPELTAKVSIPDTQPIVKYVVKSDTSQVVSYA